MTLLAADIGGTNVRLCLAHGGSREFLAEQTYASSDFSSFAGVLRRFLADVPAGTIGAACFAVAGPVRDTADGQTVKITNLPWEISARALKQEFGFPKLRLINDFEAIGYGIEALGEKDFVVLQPGHPVAHGPRAVIGAGTGLGQAILVWQGSRYDVIATEGGHTEFGPTDDLQIELARYLIKRFGRASYERVLSGPGLVRLYEFLRGQGVVAESTVVIETMKTADPAAAITDAALAHADPLAAMALDLFVRIYGAQAGNLALTAGATGGVYLAGGIAPKIISRLRDILFLDAFRSKGNMSPYVENIPVRVVMNPKVGLIGAVAVAGQ